MSNTYFAQSNPCPTLTVGDLIEKLTAFDPASKVIFQSPLYGSFGSNIAYSIGAAEAVKLERREHLCGPQYNYDEETGEETLIEDDYVQVFEAWEGVVIR